MGGLGGRACGAVLAIGPASPAAAAPAKLWRKCPTGSGAGQCLNPRGIATDPDVPGHLYVADQANSRVVELSPWGAFVRPGAGGCGTARKNCRSARLRRGVRRAAVGAE